MQIHVILKNKTQGSDISNVLDKQRLAMKNVSGTCDMCNRKLGS